MKINPLIKNASVDRHKKCCHNHTCYNCSSHVSTYNVNKILLSHRPNAVGWDYWVACDNADCQNANGEGLFQEFPEWVNKTD